MQTDSKDGLRVEVKQEKNDDVIANIIGDGNYEDEDMLDINLNRNTTEATSESALPRPSSPVSPTPLPSSSLSSFPPTSPLSPQNALPSSLNVEPVSPPTNNNSEKKQNGTSTTNAQDGNAQQLQHTPRMLNLKHVDGDGRQPIPERTLEQRASEQRERAEPGFTSTTIREFRNRQGARRTTQFFVMKTFSENHLDISTEKGIWATQHHNEKKLNDAFRRSDVVLVFSVNESRHFQGYAQMTSPIGGYKTANVWVDSKHDGVWSNAFSVKWLQRHDLSFLDTAHLRNPLNEDKPVKICRDGQEIEYETALALCTLIDNGAAKTDKKRRIKGEDAQERNPSTTRNDYSHESKRIRNDDRPMTHDIYEAPGFQSRRVVVPTTRMPLYDVKDYSKPPPALHSHGHGSRDFPARNAHGDRYVPRGADASPPPKRARSRSPPPRAHPPLASYFAADRKRKDREDFERERDRQRDRENEERFKYSRGNRDFERDIDMRGRDREERERRDGRHSPPPDLLNMSYEDYLQTLAKYRRMPQPPWGLLPSGGPLSESEYSRYLAILSKRVQSLDYR